MQFTKDLLDQIARALVKPILILHYAWTYYKSRWSAAGRSYKLESLQIDLKIGSQSTLSRALKNPTGTSSKSVIKALEVEGILKLIEERLGRPGLFECKTGEEIDALFGVSKKADRPLHEEFKCQLASDRLPLHDSESRTVRHLAKALCTDGGQLFAWTTSRLDSGASSVALELAYDEGMCASYERIIFIRPGRVDQPYEAELKEVAKSIKRSNGKVVVSGPDLVDALLDERILLVMLNSEYYDDGGSSFTKSFIENALARHEDRPAAVLTIGASKEIRATWSRKVSDELANMLKVSTKDAFELFNVHWKRFRSLREEYQAEEAGSRLKRVYWHYRFQKSPISPIHIRIRAFFASNMENYAFFDPTGGFDALAGDFGDLPDDIRYFIEDARAFVKRLEVNGVVELKMLRLLSTAKYWLTEDALIDLVRGNKVPKMKPTKIEEAISALRGSEIVTGDRIADESGKVARRYVAPLSVRAVIQDSWKKSARVERAIAHHRVAKRLRDYENEKDLLNKEFPYDPHWGRTRIHFLSECLRHLMRACGKMPDAIPDIGDLTTEFPDTPKSALQGCDPYQVVNYCYSVIYQQELNGIRARTRARALAKRHGAYLLAVEVLQLLSHNGQIGKPHPALLPQHHREFIKECGYALLDIGELEKAEACFTDLISLTDDSISAIQKVEDRLDLVLTLTIMSRKDEAYQHLEEAKLLAANNHPATDATAKAKNPYQRMLRRVYTRQAHLQYLNKDYEGARKTFDVVEGSASIEEIGFAKDDPAALKTGHLTEPDLIHVQIAALESINDPTARKQALNICLKAMFKAFSDGNQHEALGYRISYAHILRKRGEVEAAETVMDQVHSDILKFGCSERTFLSFLLEAGRILMDNHHHVRAYASYLRPCFERASSRGYGREAETAAEYSRIALDAARPMERPDGKDWQIYIDEQLFSQASLREASSPASDDPFIRDPLYGYWLAEAEDVIKMFKSREGIDSLMLCLQKG